MNTRSSETPVGDCTSERKEKEKLWTAFRGLPAELVQHWEGGGMISDFQRDGSQILFIFVYTVQRLVNHILNNLNISQPNSDYRTNFFSCTADRKWKLK